MKSVEKFLSELGYTESRINNNETAREFDAVLMTTISVRKPGEKWLSVSDIGDEHYFCIYSAKGGIENPEMPEWVLAGYTRPEGNHFLTVFLASDDVSLRTVSKLQSKMMDTVVKF